MSRAGTRLGTAAAGLLVLPLLAGGGTAVAAAPAPVAGSWTLLRLDTPVGAAPDLQAADGEALPVQNGPTGATAMSAVRFASAATSLSLARTDAAAGATSATPAEAPSVWACPAKGVWTAGDRQPWGRRPAFDCTAHVAGTDKAGIVTWDLTRLPLAGHVDVVLVPDPADTTAYSVTFGAPVAGSFVTTTAEESEEPWLPPDATAAPGAGPAVLPGLAGGGTALPGLTGGAGPGAATPPQLVPAAPRTADAPAALAGADVVAAASTGSHRWAGRALLAFLALLLMTRTALPSRPAAPPLSLLHRPESEPS